MKGFRSFKLVQHWQKVAVLLMIYDIIVVNFAYFMALWLRYDCAFSKIPEDELLRFFYFVPVYSLSCIAVFICLRLYNSIWRFASFNEMKRVVLATLITFVFHILGMNLLFGAMPYGYYIMGVSIQFLMLLGVRFFYRFILLQRGRNKSNVKIKQVMLIGAGNAGQIILRDTSRLMTANLRIVCIIDDNPNKWGRNIDGVPVVGGRDDIISNVDKYHIDQILVAIPSASDEDKRTILNICKETGCELKNLPGIYQLVSGQVSLGDMKEVAVEDLLGRKPIRVNNEELSEHIQGRVVMVTGGGGSIGSELCRQIAARSPKMLIIYDIYENNAYDIQMELQEKYPGLNLQVRIGSVRDSRCLDNVFAAYRPEIVYHAAAHKHVPLMEASPCESIKNNVIGTYKTAYSAMLYGCRRFVLISTDKAVNPTNIMGASKRLCEMIVQSFDCAIKEGKASNLPLLYTHNDESSDTESLKAASIQTEFVAVRFGNVLGSNGSVIPLFKKQIQKGGPVTVTHPDIVRYFMTIPEAVSLVMQAGVYAKGGEIFVLDMGEPVKIDELARNLIKLSGKKPDIDIPVVYTGLRPGEKLYEEKLMEEEGMKKTPNDLIHIGNPVPFDTEVFLQQLRSLMDMAYRNDITIRNAVAEMVPTYHPAANSWKEMFESDSNCEPVCAGK